MLPFALAPKSPAIHWRQGSRDLAGAWMDPNKRKEFESTDIWGQRNGNDVGFANLGGPEIENGSNGCFLSLETKTDIGRRTALMGRNQWAKCNQTHQQNETKPKQSVLHVECDK